jgi:hypothetical protein
MLAISWRIRIISVRVGIPDPAVRPVDHHLSPLVDRDLSRPLNGFSLGVENRGDLLVTFSLDRPVSIVGNYMLVLAHGVGPPSWFGQRTVLTSEA